MAAASPPEGFVPHERSSPVTDPWQPIYRCTTSNAVRLGVFVLDAHCNGRGFLHGGVITAIADNAMGLSVIRAFELAGLSQVQAFTLGISVDFVRRGQIGDWIEVRPTVHKTGKTVSLVDCDVVTGDGALIARANATFMTSTA